MNERQPPTGSPQVEFEDLFDLADLQKIQDAFAGASQVASLITRLDGTPITQPSNFCRLCKDVIRKTEKGRANCFASDSVLGRYTPDGPTIQPCLSGGLWDAGVSITVGGRHVANWLIGQVRNEAQDEATMLRYAHEIGADPDSFKAALAEVTVMSQEQFGKVAEALYLLANEISRRAYQNLRQAEIIREKERAEEALRENRRVLATILNTVPQSIFWKDRDSVYQGCNRAFAKAAGIDDPALIVGKTDFDLPWLPEESEAYRADDRFVMSANQPKPHIIEQQMQSDGQRLWLDTSKMPLTDENGTVVGVLGIYEDITERKLADEALRESEERLESVLEGSQLGLWDWDIESNTVKRNIFWTQMLGYSQDAVNQSLSEWTDLIHPEDRGRAVKSIQDHLAGLTPMHRVEYRMRAKDGLYRWILDQAKVVRRDPEGKPLRMSGTHTDITEHKCMQDVMVQTEKMMSVGGLAAGMAHEINNPLSGILQNVQVVVRRLTQDVPVNATAARAAGCEFSSIVRYAQDREIIDSLKSVREAGLRAAQIVASMLEFSRRTTSNNAPTDLGELLDKSVELCSTDYNLKKKFDFRNIRIVREYDPGLPEVPCSGPQIQQVFMNLLGNAAYAMSGQPAPVITLRTRRDGDMAVIEVEDNGCGMDQELTRKIFEPFFTTKPVGEGTGLGLSVSYFIVANNHQGSLSVNSWPGKGSRFTVRLPLTRPQG
ncbi:PocR ligand-binding domain-containing protein [Fundidesulfovibrio putealis]|uniref:PocR ligand-binding domain-containing protein n=1 Tax=Fundidesulfovibrio putealis TaxID=270496 RepID=UPI0004087E25|nr:PocR ligand-binding domain-containing protein [Fundidesulfovibrio putealis]